MKIAPRVWFCLIAGIALLVWGRIYLAPRLLGLYYERQGGQALAEVQAEIDDPTSAAPAACAQEPVTDPALHQKLDQAITFLKKSAGYWPEGSQTYLQQGRVYCLLDQPGSAVQAFKDYIRLRPENPLGHLELGFAYGQACNNAVEQRGGAYCASRERRKAIQAEWQAAGVDAGKFAAMGPDALAAQLPSQAYRWYAWNLLLTGSEEPVQAFGYIVASVASGNGLPKGIPPNAVHVYSLEDNLQIAARDLQSIPTGQPLSLNPPEDPNFGVFWWDGAAIAIVQVTKPGSFRVTLRAKNNPPAPIEGALEADLATFYKFSLTREDGSWQLVQSNLELSAGYHVIGVRYLNDAQERGYDRNLVMDWIKLERNP